jgi:hypothetical protein
MSDWILCNVCESEYKVITTNPMEAVQWCPFCGSETEESQEEESDYEEE